jgi:hypothetical protein
MFDYPNRFPRDAMANLLFVGRDMGLAELRCEIWRRAGFDASATFYDQARGLRCQTFDIVVVSYHIPEEQREMLSKWFPQSKIVDLPRHAVGRELVDLLEHTIQ